MSDPRRLLDEGSTSFESKLLRAGRKDAPAPHDRRRIAAALGVGSVFAAGTVATGASASGKTWLGLTTASAFRLTVGIVVGAVAVYGGVRALAPRPEDPSIKAAVTVKHAAPPPVSQSLTAPAEDKPAPVDTADSPPRRPAARTVPDTLSGELALLDQARHALARGDYPAALATLDDYTRRFPKRHLSSEATVLRIETLVKSGDLTQAAQLGKSFLARHPNGPYAKRVSSLIGDSRATSAPGQ
jgi:TolA-binding protein